MITALIDQDLTVVGRYRGTGSPPKPEQGCCWVPVQTTPQLGQGLEDLELARPPKEEKSHDYQETGVNGL